MSKTVATRSLSALAGKLLLPALLVCAPLAQAGTVKQFESFGKPAGDETLTLEEFDGTLGVLTKLAITFNADARYSSPINIDCSNSQVDCTRSVTAATSISLVKFERGDILLEGSDKDSQTVECTVAAGQTGTCRANASSSFSGGDSSTDAATLLSFTDDIGPLDTFNLVFRTSGFTDWFSGAVSVICTYEERAAVPEPSTLAGVAMGLMALTATAQRRRGGSRRKG